MKKLTLVLMVLLTSTTFLFSQRTISGVVQDELGEVLIGANILNPESKGVNTNYGH